MYTYIVYMYRYFIYICETHLTDLCLNSAVNQKSKKRKSEDEEERSREQRLTSKQVRPGTSLYCSTLWAPAAADEKMFVS